MKTVLRRIITLTSLFILIAIGSCNRSANVESDEVDFREYVSSLDPLELPLTLDLNTSTTMDEYNEAGFSQYKHPWAGEPFGVILDDGELVGIMDFSYGDQGLVPLLTVYDANGIMVDSTSFYTKSQSYLGYFASEKAIVRDSRTIDVIAEIRQWELNEDETEIIEETLVETKCLTTYVITESGQITSSEDQIISEE